jgi:hypothetical protein
MCKAGFSGFAHKLAHLCADRHFAHKLVEHGTVASSREFRVQLLMEGTSVRLATGLLRLPFRLRGFSIDCHRDDALLVLH